MPKIATVPFTAAMQGDERRVIELFHWILAGEGYGIEIRTCNSDNLTLTVNVGDGAGPVDWQCLTVAHDAVLEKGNLEVDQVNVTIPNCTASIEAATPISYSVGHLALNGVLDGATVIIYQYDLDGGNVFHHSTWRVEGVVSVSRSQVVLHFQSSMALLARALPPTTIQEQCNNALFDVRCGLIEAAYRVNGVATGGGRSEVYANIQLAAGWFDLGRMDFTSGNNLGASRQVYRYEPLWFVLTAPLQYAVAVGDTFTVVPGCAKTAYTCRMKYNNLDHFRGFPYLPSPEDMV